MRDFKHIFLWLILCTGLAACKKDITQKTVYDNVIYHDKPVQLYENAAQKTRVKSDLQYISIMYSNLYNKSISPGTLNDLTTLIESIGDKQLASQMILGKMLNDSFNVSMPSVTTMRGNIDQFVTNTYIKFYLRYPTPYEKYYLNNYIQQHAALKPAIIYTGFILSNEYHYY